MPAKKPIKKAAKKKVIKKAVKKVANRDKPRPPGRPTKEQKAAEARSRAGRPKVVTAAKIKMLEHAFSIGTNVKEALLYSGVSKTSYYSYIEENPEFQDRIDSLRHNVPLQAKTKVFVAIEEGDVNTAKWYLERKCKDEFSIKTEIEAKQEVTITAADKLRSLPKSDLIAMRDIYERNGLIGAQDD